MTAKRTIMSCNNGSASSRMDQRAWLLQPGSVAVAVADNVAKQSGRQSLLAVVVIVAVAEPPA